MEDPIYAQTLEDKYKGAYKLLLETRDQLEQLETGQDSSDIIQGRISGNVNTLARLASQLEMQIGQQNATTRELWRMYLISTFLLTLCQKDKTSF
jgi:hypothetical protein